jgi:prenyl protein peptidase
MGFRAPGLLAAAVFPLALVALLFAGPLLYAFYTDTLIPQDLLHSPIGLRNLVAAPITEELCFRAGLLSYLLASGVSPSRALWLSPLTFGLAHVHHVYDLVKYQGWAVSNAAVAATFQVAYTTVRDI